MKNAFLIPVIREIQNQNMSHFAELFENFEGLIYCYGKRLCYEDATQELTLFLLELLDSLDTDRFPCDDSQGVQKYIAVSLRNRYIFLSKKQQKTMCQSDKPVDQIGVELETEEAIALKSGLKSLSERQRLAVTYRYCYGYSDCEIAQIMGISRQAVNRLHKRGLTSLKEYFGEEEEKIHHA